MKRYTVEIDDKGTPSCSDGYHTFDELYEHRCLLFINLCINMYELAYWRPHYEGWPLLGIELPYGQITYHVPEKYLPLFRERIKEGGPEWDGHTSEKVIERLTQTAKFFAMIPQTAEEMRD